MADGLRTFSVGELPWAHISTQVHDIVTVTEDELRAAIVLIWSRTKQLVEPSAALPVAALLAGAVQPVPARPAVVLSGGNVDAAALAAALG